MRLLELDFPPLIRVNQFSASQKAEQLGFSEVRFIQLGLQKHLWYLASIARDHGGMPLAEVTYNSAVIMRAKCSMVLPARKALQQPQP